MVIVMKCWSTTQEVSNEVFLNFVGCGRLVLYNADRVHSVDFDPSVYMFTFIRSHCPVRVFPLCKFPIYVIVYQSCTLQRIKFA